MIQTTTYLRTLLNEKGISLDYTFEIPSENIFGKQFVPIEVVIEFIGSLDKGTQLKIQETLMIIDFKNGNVIHFLEFITKGMVELKF